MEEGCHAVLTQSEVGNKGTIAGSAAARSRDRLFTVDTEETTQALRQMGEPVRGDLFPSLQWLNEEETGPLREKMGEDELDL